MSLAMGISNKVNLVLSVLLINVLVSASDSLAAEKKNNQAAAEERQREIEKAVFMASASQERILRIGLVDCIAYALKNNSEIRIERIEPQLKEADVGIAKAAFEPTAAFDYNLHSTIQRSTSALYPGVSKTRDIDFNAGVSGKLITGTEYDVNFLNQRYTGSSATQNPNPYYTSEPQLIITQPLFRNAGILVNRADIIVAQNNKQISTDNFRYLVMDAISKTKIAYYNYIYNLQNYALYKTSLGRAQQLWEINRARYAKGLLSSVDLLETEAAVSEREKSVLSAEADVKSAEDNLKLITNLVDNPETWNARVELIDPELEFEEERNELLECLKSAFANRPDYNAQKINLKSRDIKIVTARNALLPTVDLVTSFGLNGLGSNYQEALKKASGNYKDWSAGFSVSVPWGGEERAKFEQRNLEKARALLELKRLEQNIILEVRDKVRVVNTQIRQVRVAQLTQEKEFQNYEAQKERYAAGQVSTHDMLDYQEKLANAQLDHVKALIGYNIALINLDKSEGLTLIRNNVKLEA